MSCFIELMKFVAVCLSVHVLSFSLYMSLGNTIGSSRTVETKPLSGIDKSWNCALKKILYLSISSPPPLSLSLIHNHASGEEKYI